MTTLNIIVQRKTGDGVKIDKDETFMKNKDQIATGRLHEPYSNVRMKRSFSNLTANSRPEDTRVAFRNSTFQFVGFQC